MSDIPFVFDTLGCSTEPMLEPNPPQQLSDDMHRAWVRFARSGDSGRPRYKPPQRLTMHFDATSRVVEDPMGSTLSIWRGAR